MSPGLARRRPGGGPRGGPALPLGPGERVLAQAALTSGQGQVVATTWAVALVAENGEVVLRRPWHEVRAGAWEPLTGTVSITWTDGTRAAQWSVAEGGGRFADVFHQRVQSSVVLSEPVELGGRLMGQAVLRKDLRTGELSTAVVLERGVPGEDPDVQAAVAAATAWLRDQVGL